MSDAASSCPWNWNWCTPLLKRRTEVYWDHVSERTGGSSHLRWPNATTTRCWNPIFLLTRKAFCLLMPRTIRNGVYSVSPEWERQFSSFSGPGRWHFHANRWHFHKQRVCRFLPCWLEKKDTGSGWNQNSRVYCKRKLEVFTINLLPFGWGKTLARGFQMTALYPTPQSFWLLLFLHKTIQIENENCVLSCWCMSSSGLPSGFIVNG